MADAFSAELMPIDGNPTIDLSDYDLIGFGSAINFAAHDIHLQKFVSEQNLNGKNIFIFSTRCRPLLGAYHKPLRKIIEKKGGKIIGEFSCRGYDRTGPWVLMDGYNKARPDERDIFKARLFADKLRRKVLEKTIMHDAEHIAGNKTVFLNTSTCVNCGKCIAVCPMHIFVRKDKVVPFNDENCIQCQLCADKCPTSSIFIKESFLNGLRIALRESFSDKLQKCYNSNNSGDNNLAGLR